MDECECVGGKIVWVRHSLVRFRDDTLGEGIPTRMRQIYECNVDYLA
jgi:hypothetical protein